MTSYDSSDGSNARQHLQSHDGSDQEVNDPRRSIPALAEPVSSSHETAPLLLHLDLSQGQREARWGVFHHRAYREGLARNQEETGLAERVRQVALSDLPATDGGGVQGRAGAVIRGESRWTPSEARGARRQGGRTSGMWECSPRARRAREDHPFAEYDVVQQYSKFNPSIPTTRFMGRARTDDGLGFFRTQRTRWTWRTDVGTTESA